MCVLLVDKHDTLSTKLHLFVSLTAHVHASVNFIIYGVCNKKIRNVYKLIILKHLLCKDPPHIRYESSHHYRGQQGSSHHHTHTVGHHNGTVDNNTMPRSPQLAAMHHEAIPLTDVAHANSIEHEERETIPLTDVAHNGIEHEEL